MVLANKKDPPLKVTSVKDFFVVISSVENLESHSFVERKAWTEACNVPECRNGGGGEVIG